MCLQKKKGPPHHTWTIQAWHDEAIKWGTRAAGAESNRRA